MSDVVMLKSTLRKLRERYMDQASAIPSTVHGVGTECNLDHSCFMIP